MTFRITTQRLIIRPFTPADLAAMHAVWSDPEVMTPVPSPVYDWQKSRARLGEKISHQARHGFSRWAVVDAASGAVIGECGLQYLDGGPEIELGYKLARSHWGRGLAVEAARACLAWAMAERPEQIVAIVDRANVRSARVLTSIGMTPDGTRYCFGHRWDCYVAPRGAPGREPAAGRAPSTSCLECPAVPSPGAPSRGAPGSSRLRLGSRQHEPRRRPAGRGRNP